MQELFICEKCSKEFKTRNALSAHQIKHTGANIQCPTCKRCFLRKGTYDKHKCNPPEVKVSHKKACNSSDFNTPIESFCQFCNRKCHNLNSLKQHEIRCKLNPDKINTVRAGFNNRGRAAWNKELTKEIDPRLQRISESIKATLKSNPKLNHGGIKQRSAKRCKYGTYQGFYCDSGWELAFLVYHLDHTIAIERNGDYFEYTYEDKLHKYYPDFIIGDTYYEIKGIYRENDQAKIDQFPNTNKLVVIDSKHINTYVKYCEHKYGKDYAKILYDRNYPCWLDNIDKTDKKYNFKLV